MSADIQNGLPISIGGSIVAPEGCRIHILKMKVQVDRPWQEAIHAAAPRTPGHYNIWKMGELFPPAGTGVVEQEIILLNYTNVSGNWDKANAWANECGLKRTDPRQIFAIAEQHPRLDRDVGIRVMYIVATKDCIFEDKHQACYVWWHLPWREANLYSIGNYGHMRGWFAFQK